MHTIVHLCICGYIIVTYAKILLFFQCLRKLKQSPFYFPYEKLEFREELGSGAFGVVKKALAHSIELDKSSTIVAVKTLKGKFLAK